MASSLGRQERAHVCGGFRTKIRLKLSCTFCECVHWQITNAHVAAVNGAHKITKNVIQICRKPVRVQRQSLTFGIYVSFLLISSCLTMFILYLPLHLCQTFSGKGFTAQAAAELI